MERLSRERSELSRKNTGRMVKLIVAKELYSSEWWNGKDLFHSILSEIYFATASYTYCTSE
jgi:hypothetical protein